MVTNLHTISPKGNELLNALPPSTFEKLLPDMELVNLESGKVIVESGGTLSHAYFPTTGVISLLNALRDGGETEFALVGKEGMIGISLIMGGGTVPFRAVVQNTGHAYRVRSKLVLNTFHTCKAAEKLMLRYLQFLMTQVGQAAVCNRHHTLVNQLSTWLLFSLDRLPTDEVLLTHKSIANTLGVRRESITETVGELQKKGLIECTRGHIHIVDRAGLEDTACECYKVVTSEKRRLLSDIYGTPIIKRAVAH